MRMRSYSNLSEEITFDILSLLPAKSVGQCSCVSKSWRALLSRPEFIRTHLRKSRILRHESLAFFDCKRYLFSAPLRNAHHLFGKITLSPTKLTFDHHPNPWGWVYATCDGLLLTVDSQDNKYVLNPVIREIRKVPCLPFEVLSSLFHLDPDRNPHTTYGFGYDSVHDDYKVVVISYYSTKWDDDDNEIAPHCTEMFVNVYSLRSGSWKSVKSSQYDHSGAGCSDSGVFVDGRIHWLASNTADRIHDMKLAIVAFDLAEDMFYELPPTCMIESDRILFFHLSVLGGCLCLFDEYDACAWWVSMLV